MITILNLVELSKKEQKKVISDISYLMCELWNEYDSKGYETGIKNFMKSKNYSILVAYKNNIAIGYLEYSLEHSYEEAYSEASILKICGLYVAKSIRHENIATTLIQKAEELARNIDCEKIISSYFDFNTASENLHQKLGFIPTSKLVNVVKIL